MASLVNVTSINVIGPIAPANSDFKFEIGFEATAALKEELEWKLIYVGSAEDEKFDQELESVLVGPVALGKNKFVFEAPCPDLSKVPSKDLLGVTVVLLTCAYKSREFLRVGYYLNTFYGDEALRLAPPAVVNVSALHREILADRPRVTRFQIPWHDEELAGAAAFGIFPLPPAGPVGVEPEPEEGDMALGDEDGHVHDNGAGSAGDGDVVDEDREVEGMRVGHSHSASAFGFGLAAAAPSKVVAEERKTPAASLDMDMEDL